MKAEVDEFKKFKKQNPPKCLGDKMVVSGKGGIESGTQTYVLG